jgi:phage shock protein A
MNRATWKRNRRRLALQRDLRPLVHMLGYLKREVEDLESAPEDTFESIRQEIRDLDNRLTDLEDRA